MASAEALQFQNLLIENVAAETDAGQRASSRGSLEFLCGRALEQNESMCVPIAVSEFSVADLIGHPCLLGRIEHPDGHVEFRYRLSGPLCPHPC
jgi:hypothetical protein